MKYDVIIIGAGASGLMCASEAGGRGRSVLVLDHASRAGNKVRVSGGGRCNFTNADVRAEHYVSGNGHFCRSALARFTPRDFICMIEGFGIGYVEKDGGCFFCDGSSSLILQMLHRRCSEAGVRINLGCEIESVEKKDGLFDVGTSGGIFTSESLVVATGGLSYPKLGASGFGYDLARHFGLKVVEPRPGLAPLVLAPEDREIWGELSGVAVLADVKCGKRTFRGGVLFTHRGLSGPAILQTSLYWRPGEFISLDLLPNVDLFGHLSAGKDSSAELHNILSGLLPRRFVMKWCGENVPSMPLKRFSEKDLRRISEMLKNWRIRPAGTEGYSVAEVTSGGVDTDEISSKTMEAKSVPGLYFIGEVLDVTGHLGGYNLQWAWSSGHAAGQYV